MNTTPDKSNEQLATRRLRARNWALLGLLMGFVVIVYLVTIIKVRM